MQQAVNFLDGVFASCGLQLPIHKVMDHAVVSELRGANLVRCGPKFGELRGLLSNTNLDCAGLLLATYKGIRADV